MWNKNGINLTFERGEWRASVYPSAHVRDYDGQVYTRRWQVQLGDEVMAEGWAINSDYAVRHCEAYMVDYFEADTVLAPAFVQWLYDLREASLPTTVDMYASNGMVMHRYHDERIAELERLALANDALARWTIELLARATNENERLYDLLEEIQEISDKRNGAN